MIENNINCTVHILTLTEFPVKSWSSRPLGVLVIRLKMRCHRLHVPLRPTRPSQERDPDPSRGRSHPRARLTVGGHCELPRCERHLLLGFSSTRQLLPESRKFSDSFRACRSF